VSEEEEDEETQTMKKKSINAAKSHEAKSLAFSLARHTFKGK
jgi:hypothetical protein